MYLPIWKFQEQKIQTNTCHSAVAGGFSAPNLLQIGINSQRNAMNTDSTKVSHADLMRAMNDSSISPDARIEAAKLLSARLELDAARPTTVFAVQMAILAELRKQTALLMQLTNSVGSSGRPLVTAPEGMRNVSRESVARH